MPRNQHSDRSAGKSKGTASQRETPGASAEPTGALGRAIPPSVLALLLTGATLFVVLGFLRPGYWINDDLKIAWLLAGYPAAGDPIPFAVHSNVLVGLLLVPLFNYAGSINWFAIFLELTNAVSAAILVYLAMSAFRQPRQRLIAGLVVLGGMALFFLEVSFTISAFLASLAGFVLVWTSTQHPTLRRGHALAGIAMVLLGSVIRLEMLLMATAISLPPLLFLSIRLRRFVSILAIIGFVVFAAYALGRLYVRARPDWNTFYAYTQVREQIHDTHRLANVHGQIRRIGWTPNDQELFARWHYPDQSTYSYEHLAYLQEKVSPFSQNPGATLAAWFPQMLGGRNTPYLVVLLGILAWAASQQLDYRRQFALAGTALAAIAIDAALAIVYKNPDYVQACTVAAAALLAAPLLRPDEVRRQLPRGSGDPRGPARLGLACVGLVLIAVGTALELGNVFSSSSTNALRREEYAQIRSDLLALADTHVLPQLALIVTPAHGLPYEWSDPFELDRPVPAFLDTGWITFSPSYRSTLEKFRIDSLPEALVSRDDVFLMTQEDLTPFMSRYYDEHYGMAVEFDPLYQMPNPSHWAGYDRIFIYRIRPKA
jgi:hypothetical protein